MPNRRDLLKNAGAVSATFVLESLPWFEPGKPLRNWMLHETDFYDEVTEIWGRRWGAEGLGTLREVLVSRRNASLRSGSVAFGSPWMPTDVG